MIDRTIDPELSLVGALLLCPEYIKPTSEAVEPRHFADGRCRDVYTSALDVCAESPEPDYVLITAEAKKRNGGITNEWLRDAMDLCPTPSNYAFYATLVIDGFKRRELAALGARLVDVGEDSATLLAETIKVTDGLQAAGRTAHLYSSSEAVRDFLESLEAVENGQSIFVPSGFHALDDLLGGGLRKGGLYILGARTSVGKTSLALAIADRIALPTLFASLEMKQREITGRRFARESGIPGGNLSLAGKSEEYADKIAGTALKLAASPLQVCDMEDLSVADLASLARRIPSIGAIVVDYLGIMQSPNRHGSLREKTEEVTRDLKKLAMRMGIPILALCQLSRGAATRDDKTPTLTDLRESGSIEQDADCVMLLHQVSSPDPMTGAINIDLIVAKNRSGAKGTIPMRTLPKCFAWREDYSRMGA